MGLELYYLWTNFENYFIISDEMTRKSSVFSEPLLQSQLVSFQYLQEVIHPGLQRVSGSELLSFLVISTP